MSAWRSEHIRRIRLGMRSQVTRAIRWVYLRTSNVSVEQCAVLRVEGSDQGSTKFPELPKRHKDNNGSRNFP
jgi:uncharacterized protein with PhoU and TrkA domain